MPFLLVVLLKMAESTWLHVIHVERDVLFYSEIVSIRHCISEGIIIRALEKRIAFVDSRMIQVALNVTTFIVLAGEAFFCTAADNRRVQVQVEKAAAFDHFIEIFFDSSALWMPEMGVLFDCAEIRQSL
jgi:hypothetical protein